MMHKLDFRSKNILVKLKRADDFDSALMDFIRYNRKINNLKLELNAFKVHLMKYIHTSVWVDKKVMYVVPDTTNTARFSPYPSSFANPMEELNANLNFDEKEITLQYRRFHTFETHLHMYKNLVYFCECRIERFLDKLPTYIEAVKTRNNQIVLRDLRSCYFDEANLISSDDIQKWVKISYNPKYIINRKFIPINRITYRRTNQKRIK